MKFLLLTFFISISASATCFMTKKSCAPKNNFQQVYQITKTSCSPPGGPVHTTVTFSILSKIAQCQKAKPCLKRVFSHQISSRRDDYFLAQMSQIKDGVFLTIIDNRTLAEGEVNMSTPRGQAVLLDDYKCTDSFN